jgi:hypothetical protein
VILSLRIEPQTICGEDRDAEGYVVTLTLFRLVLSFAVAW